MVGRDLCSCKHSTPPINFSSPYLLLNFLLILCALYYYFTQFSLKKLIITGPGKTSMTSSSKDDKIITAENCVQAGWQAGFRAACITCVSTAIPTLAAVRTIPWAKASINYTGQALIISGASIAAFFITADKTILEGAKKNARYCTKP